jgi:hypothetical protein
VYLLDKLKVCCARNICRLCWIIQALKQQINVENHGLTSVGVSELFIEDAQGRVSKV